MAQKQNPKTELLCTYKKCRELQNAENGEYCYKHYLKLYGVSKMLPEELKQERLISKLNLNPKRLIILNQVLELERELTLMETS